MFSMILLLKIWHTYSFNKNVTFNEKKIWIFYNYKKTVHEFLIFSNFYEFLNYISIFSVLEKIDKLMNI